MDKQFVKPADGLTVRDPARGDHLPAEGREVALTTYWQRRLRDGDVVPATKPKGDTSKTDKLAPDTSKSKSKE